MKPSQLPGSALCPRHLVSYFSNASPTVTPPPSVGKDSSIGPVVFTSPQAPRKETLSQLSPEVGPDCS